MTAGRSRSKATPITRSPAARRARWARRRFSVSTTACGWRYPTKGGQRATWADVDAEIAAALARTKQEARAVRILTPTITSPTTAALIADFLSGFPNARHVTYDPISASAVLDAHALTHGARLMPQYRFDQADVIVSFDADFLGTWISPVQFTRGLRRAGGGSATSRRRPSPITCRSNRGCR